ncbi:hypothetical protein Zmor_001721 [Zophobas morio]|uniref:Uncharacterized protein n=1 Tax=Zophobas morio TaxID=2755281 RepID=A0AA38IZI9_9CUCU|nr:hypothetical protein Zmor_001721 [Zophobas morio]
MEQIARFMGHTEKTHMEFYRLSDDIYQTAKVAKVLLMLNAGKGAEFKEKDTDKSSIYDFTEEESSNENYFNGTAQNSRKREETHGNFTNKNFREEESKDGGALTSNVVVHERCVPDEVKANSSQNDTLVFNRSTYENVEIERKTRTQALNPLLSYKEKSVRLTASNFGKVCRMRKLTSTANAVKASGLTIKSLEYGRTYERTAVQSFETNYGKKVDDCGLFVDLAASPNGLIGGRYRTT